MRILAHRGFWKQSGSKNSIEAIAAAFNQGWGIETDVRSIDGKLLLSHDPIDRRVATPWEQMVTCWNATPSLPLFLNIKEDGLLELLKPYLDGWRDRTVVCFDMSVPELVRYSRALPSAQLATRISEWEDAPLRAYCDWIWCDGFESGPELERLYPAKGLAFVSPELHGRPANGFRAKLERFAEKHPMAVLLCTDDPEGATFL